MCCSVLQCVVVCCSVLQCVAVCCSVVLISRKNTCCSVLQCRAPCPRYIRGHIEGDIATHCNTLQHTATHASELCCTRVTLQHTPSWRGQGARRCNVLQCAVMCYSVPCNVLQFGGECPLLLLARAGQRVCCGVLQCSVLQCVAVCCSVLCLSLQECIRTPDQTQRVFT